MKSLIIAISSSLLLSLCCGAAVSEHERAIINAPAEEKHRCWNVSPEECRKERENWHKRGCISDWAKRELEKKSGPDGEESGYPVCDSDFVLHKWCYCGCFHPETLLLVFDHLDGVTKNVMAKDIAANTQQYDLVVLNENSSLERISLSRQRIEKRTKGPEEDPLVFIELESGIVLKLSSQHAVLLSDGQMIVAEELHAEHSLVDIDGNASAIRSITREHTELEVINFMTAGTSARNHMLIAEGMIVGDLAWQNELVPLLNKRIFDDSNQAR